MRRRVTTARRARRSRSHFRPARLQPGAIIADRSDWYLEVEAAEEPVLAVLSARPPSGASGSPSKSATIIFPLPSMAKSLLVPDDTAMAPIAQPARRAVGTYAMRCSIRSARGIAMNAEALLTLAAIQRRAFPAGAYAHSFGLETYVTRGDRVQTQTASSSYLRAYLEGSAGPTDAVLRS